MHFASLKISAAALGVIALLMPVSPGMAQAGEQNPQMIFNRANQQLMNGDIPRALTLYHRLEKQNNISGALFLNMGLSYIRMDSMGKAKYYFMKARQFEETRERAQNGLEYVGRRFSRQSAVLPTLPWQRASNWLSDRIGAMVLLGIGLILLNAGIVLYIIPWFSRFSYRFISTAGAATAAIGLLVVLLSFYIDYREQRYHQAVMVQREAAVREQPRPEATVVNQAFEGYTFTVDRQTSRKHEGWSYIRMSNGQYGWIPTREIMIL